MKQNRLFMYFGIALIVLIMDQITKYLVKTKVALYDAVPVIGQFFMITSHRNRGAAFSILQNQRWFFILITVAVAVGIIVYLRRVINQKGWLLPFALSILLGGAIGNFFDRALFGEVVDFFQFHFVFQLFGKQIDYIYPIFNIADCGIVVGVILILLDSLIKWRKEKEGYAHGDQLHDGQ